MSSLNFQISNILKLLSLLVIVVFATGCLNKEPVVVEPEPVVTPPPVEPALSPLPLDDLTEIDYKVAQAALDQLGYNVGYVDGIWGPRSAAALKQFENDFQLISANGRLSELNFTRLTDRTTVRREDFLVQPTTRQAPVTPEPARETGITAKLDPNVPLSQSPQLIITDQSYKILSKPNPYSQTLMQLPRGAGLYIISLQEGWYEVETLERKRGYIQK